MVKRLLKRLFTPGDRLSQRVIHAGFWAFALRITYRLFGLARTIVLARVLSPNDFGLFGIALLGLSALNTFSQTGFQAALVQKKGDIKPYLDTAWTVQVIRGFVLAGILFGIAPYVASFFGEPMAASLLRVLGLSAAFQGLTNIGVVYFQKELEFHKRFIYMFSGTLANLGVAIPAALILRNAWALVFGLLTGNFVQMAVSYLIHPYRPRMWLDGPKVKELYVFGKWILGSKILVFFLNQGDDIFVGKLLGATMLGFYQIAYRLSNLPATEITHVTSQVTFPAYSKLQDRLPQLREAYLRTLRVIAFLSFPLAGGIAFLAPDFTRIFLGEKWMPMVPAMQILAIWGLSRSIAATTGPLFSGMGKPWISTWLQLAKLILIAGFIYPFTTLWGIVGTASAITASALLIDPICLYIAARLLRSKAWDIMKTFLIPIIGTLVMLFCMTSLSKILEAKTLAIFVGYIALGCSAYVLVIGVFDRSFIKQIWFSTGPRGS